MKKISACTTVLWLILLTNTINSQTGPILWESTLGARITSSPVIDDTLLYHGCDDHSVYAHHIQTGTRQWSYNTGSPVKSTPLPAGDFLFITSGNHLFALNKLNGEAVWNYAPPELETSNSNPKLDEWDYHHSSPILYADKLFYGDEFGNIHGINSTSGVEEFIFTTEDRSPKRSTPAIKNDTLFFGDWNGWIYAVDMTAGTLIWKYRSFDHPPYASFGPIITQPLIHNNKLYVGARNDLFSVLHTGTGDTAWTYKDPSMGWISGTPLIRNDTLYIGGSDNRQMIAFNAESGEVYWKYNTQVNLFCKPLYHEGMLIFGDGDSYNHMAGKGYLYLLDAKTGNHTNIFCPGRNIFSSVAIKSNRVFLTGYGGSLYCIDLDSLIQSEVSSILCTAAPADTMMLTQGQTGNFKFSIANQGTKIDSVMCEINSADENIIPAVRFNPEKFLSIPNEEKQLSFIVDGRELAAGEYEVTISVWSETLEEAILSKSSTIIVDEPASLIDAVNMNGYSLYPNPVTDILHVEYEQGPCNNLFLSIHNMQGATLYRNAILPDQDHNHLFTIDLSKLLVPPGVYIVRIIHSDQLQWTKKILYLSIVP